MDIKKTKAYETFYYKLLSFGEFREFKRYLKFHYWYYENSPSDIKEQIKRIYQDLKRKSKQKEE